ncbi:peptide chain release factor N(5)-glutamine methyltransferase [Candidatus Woesebacteria bacterium]|nr:peptide chain release factor N(5)-glutamine methyltransferase [Candidatus Woesebacteria bacterium]
MRILDPYEQTQLARYGKSVSSVASDTIPIEYVTGKAEFCGLSFDVSPEVLIPRIETEELVDLTLHDTVELLAAHTHTAHKQIKLVEVGTGSGAIAVTLALQLGVYKKYVSLFATDISAPAIAVAQQNQKYLLSTQHCALQFLQADLLDHPTLPSKIDIVVANLPYIPSARIPTLASSVIDHEPHQALDGGVDGFMHIERLLIQAAPHLNFQSKVLLEVDHTHTQEFMHSKPTLLKLYTFEYLLDEYGQNRFLRVQKK